MRFRFTVILVVLMAASILAQTAKIDTSKIVYAPMDSLQNGLDMALKAMKMTRADLTFRGDYLEEDVYRIPFINALMKNPLKIIDYAASRLQIDSLKDFGYLKILSTDLKNSSGLILHAVKTNKTDMIPPNIKKQLTPPQIDFLNRLFVLAAIVDPRNWPAYTNYSKAQIDSLAYGFTLLLEENVEDEFLSVDVLDSLAQYEDQWAQALVTLADGCQGRGEIIDDYIEFLSKTKDSAWTDLFKNSKPVSFSTKYGQVIIGDTSANSYNGDLFIVIDPGGNDTYNIKMDSTCHQTCIFDFSGDDTYNMPKNRISPYFFGGQMIVDFSGDDTYNARSWTLGAGLFGVGFLWDKKGNDRYYGDTFTQGAGCFGVGILKDDAGNDSYQAALYSQGFGFVDGIGILMDNSGNDTYFAGGKYKDVLRYEDHYLSLSQGFAYGIRPKMSGGIGMLIDKSGNDVYISDIFAQGTGYWYGLGVLSDGGGNDQYVSFQYAQGCATHMALGIIYEVSGDDSYIGKGLMQGVGHDRATGICLDLSGNDNYNAYDLSQGAGSANGFGLLADISGKDIYIVRSADNTQGYGRPDRNYGSIGILLDLQGKDGYGGGYGADSTWWTGPLSKWGVGIDK